MRNKYSIKPILRLDKIRSDGKCPIAIQVIINGRVLKRSSGIFTSSNDWDKELSRVKTQVSRSAIVNNRITKAIFDLEEHLNKTESYKGTLTLEDVKSFYESEKKVYLYDFWEQQLQVWSKDLRPTTIKNYTCTLNRLKELSSNPLLLSIDYRFIAHFDAFLKTQRNNTLAGANTRHKCLKSILKEAKRQGLIDSIPYENFKLKKCEGKKVFLTEQEVKTLINLKIPVNMPHLEEVRDMFLFGCYTGLRISDVTNLKWQDISGDKIRIRMVKTRQYLVTGLIKITRNIIEKYRYKTSEYVFPRKSHQKINKNLKKLMVLCKIKKNVSFHCARHTFASLLIQNNVNLNDIKDFLGHENISVTMNYVHSIDETRLAKLKLLES